MAIVIVLINNPGKINVQLQLQGNFSSLIVQLRVFKQIGYSKMHNNYHERVLCVVGEKKKSE